MKNLNSLIAPNPSPFGDVILGDEIKPNGKTTLLERTDLYEMADFVRNIEGMSLAAADDSVKGLITAFKNFIATVGRRRVEKNQTNGEGWIYTAQKMIDWLEAGMPTDSPTTSFKVLNKLNGWSVFGRGNSKLPYLAFSTLPGVTCPGAGECLTAPGNKPSTTRRMNGGWCYSFKAWRYPAAFFRQLGNTLLLRSPKGRDYIARCFASWAESDARIKGGETVRLYVDGDIDSLETLRFWMDNCIRHPHVRAYGYSKSWHIFLQYQKLGYQWPTNYVLNLSAGSKFFAMPALREAMLKLPITREDFGVVNIEKKGKAKLKQNVITLDPASSTGVFGAIRRLEKRVTATVDPTEKTELASILADWNETAQRLVNGEKIVSVPDEFWSRNPDYTAAVSKSADKLYGKGNYFVCPGKCGNCLGNGKHACGEIRLKVPVVIGIH